RGALATENFKHDGAAGGAFAFNGFAPVLHRFLDAIDDFLLGFAFDAVSFGHKKFCCLDALCAAAVTGEYLRCGLSLLSTVKRRAEYGWRCGSPGIIGEIIWKKKIVRSLITASYISDDGCSGQK